MRSTQLAIGTETPAFDPDTLTNSDRAVVADCAHEVWNFKRRTVRDALAVGRKLQAVKKILGHGRFIAWLRKECAWSEDTAERLMKAASRFPRIPHTAEFTLTALYILAGDDVPEAAREEAMERATKGERITPAVAKAIKTRHSATDVQAAPPEEGRPDVPPLSDTHSSEDVTADGRGLPDPTDGCGSDSAPARRTASSCRRRVENAARAARHGANAHDDGTDRHHRGTTTSDASMAATPCELVVAIDGLLALMPNGTRPGRKAFLREVRKLSAKGRSGLKEKVTRLSDALVDLQRNL